MPSSFIASLNYNHMNLQLMVSYLEWPQTDTKKISAVSIFFETMPDRLKESTGYIDYDQVKFLFLAMMDLYFGF